MRVACLMFVLAAAPAVAQDSGNYFTGNKLHEFAHDVPGTMRGAFSGYVAAVHDAKREEGKFCVPKGATLGQLADVAKEYLARNPEIRHMDGDLLVSAAFRQAWPCQK